MNRGRSAALATMIGATLAWASPASGAEAAPRLEATIDGVDIARADGNRPIRLSGQKPARVAVKVTNSRPRTLQVRSIRILGPVAGVTFFSYETRVDMEIPPGATEDRTYEVDLVDLADQATGLLPGRMVLLDQRRNEIASRTFAAEVEGSLSSVYGMFGLIVAAMTAVQLGGALWLLARRQPSPNRWKRGVRLGVAGIGMGLTLTFSMSAFALLLPSAESSLTVILITTIAMFALGYFSPTPEMAEAYEPVRDPTARLSAPITLPLSRRSKDS